jgi:hypothetical protein
MQKMVFGRDQALADFDDIGDDAPPEDADRLSLLAEGRPRLAEQLGRHRHRHRQPRRSVAQEGPEHVSRHWSRFEFQALLRDRRGA